MKEQSKMLSKFIAEGMKLTLEPAEKTPNDADDKAEKLYHSMVCEILSEDTVEIQMPMEQQKMILLPVGKEYELSFFAGAVMYKCFARVKDRYKSGNLFLLLMELTSNLRKHQRREYYRFSCILEMMARNLEEDELDSASAGQPLDNQHGQPLKRSVIVDISGGGLRFISDQRYEPGSFLLCNYNLYISGQRKQYEVVGKVLACRELENKKGNYEHRVQYHNMDEKVREAIIKYIFEEERKNRAK